MSEKAAREISFSKGRRVLDDKSRKGAHLEPEKLVI
jgi:hypothetical protein